MGMKVIDGKPVRKFIFARHSALLDRTVSVEVEAFNKDHAIGRLEAEYSYIQRNEWEFIHELEVGQFLGKLGARLPLNPHGVS